MLSGMARRGGRAVLWDALHWLRAKASAALRSLGARTGEGGMARLVGPYGPGGYGNGPQLLSKQEQVLHFRGWNYRCIDYIARRVAKDPPLVVRAAAPTDREKYKLATKAYLAGRGDRPEPRAFASPYWREKSVGPARPNEELEFVPDSDPLARLLADPNDPDTGPGFWYEAELFNCLTGEDFVWVVEDDAGRPDELWVIPSHWVRPVCLGRERLVDHFEVVPRGASAALTPFDPDEIVWTRWPSPLSKLYPQATTQAAAALVDTYEKVDAARNFSLDNGAMVGGTVKLDPTVQLTEASIQRMESRFYARHQGVFNANRPIFLEGAEYVPPPPEQELAFMQSQDTLRRYVMAMWGLDECVLGFASVPSRAAMVAALVNVNRNTIDPRKRTRAAVLTEKLARRFDPRYRLFYPPDKDEFDPDARRQDFAAATAANAASANDWRTHVLDLEPWPEEIYDRPLVSAGLVNPGADGGAAWDLEPGGGGPGGGLPDQADGLSDDADLSPDADFKAAAAWVGKGHGPPPFPGARFDESRHRWVKPDGGEPEAAHRAVADVATARSLAAKIGRAGSKAVEAAKRVGERAKELAYRIANSGLSPNDVLDDVFDHGRIITARNTGDWLGAHLGVSGNTAAVVASHVLAYGLTKVRQHLRARAGGKSADAPGREAVVAEVLRALLAEMGCPGGDLPGAGTAGKGVRGKVRDDQGHDHSDADGRFVSGRGGGPGGPNRKPGGRPAALSARAGAVSERVAGIVAAAGHHAARWGLDGVAAAIGTAASRVAGAATAAEAMGALRDGRRAHRAAARKVLAAAGAEADRYAAGLDLPDAARRSVGRDLKAAIKLDDAAGYHTSDAVFEDAARELRSGGPAARRDAVDVLVEGVRRAADPVGLVADLREWAETADPVEVFDRTLDDLTTLPDDAPDAEREAREERDRAVAAGWMKGFAGHLAKLIPPKRQATPPADSGS